MFSPFAGILSPVMNVKRIFRRAAALWFAAVLFLCQTHATPCPSAGHAILLDAGTGRVLYEKNADEPAAIASTTKIMTALLIIERCNLEDTVEIPPEAVGVEGSTIYLKAGEVLTVRTLLYGLMLHSGNDAAVALAIHCSGSVESFAQLMNRRAEALGLTHTHFCNPHGLDEPGHCASARDLALLAAEAMENSVFREIVSTKTITLEGRSFTNHNKLLWQVEGAVGVKTGYTKSAGRILVSCAERGGRRLVAVTLNDPDDWRDHGMLFDTGFSSFAMQTVAEEGQVMGSTCVMNADGIQAEAVLKEKIALFLAPSEQVALAVDLPQFVFAPVKAGEVAGSVRILVDGSEIISVPIYWRNSVGEVQ